MRTTITIDDELFAEAVQTTGITEKKKLIERALRELISKEASISLAKLGGTMPGFKVPERYRPD